MTTDLAPDLTTEPPASYFTSRDVPSLGEFLTNNARLAARYNANRPQAKRGEDIFGPDSDYPRTWDEFVGQTEAVKRIYAACHSARVEGRARVDHILLASGHHGVGKSALAKLIAYQLGVGLVEISGPTTVDEARPLLRSMRDGDILFIDEALALDTPVPTPTGWTTIGALSAGDTIMGSSGTPVRVKRLTEIATDHRCFNVTFDDATTIVADAGHKWSAAPRVAGGSGYGNPRIVTTQQMVDRRTDWRVPLTAPVELPDAPLPVDPYVLGQWLGNGSAGQPHIYVRRGLTEASIAEFAEAGETVKNLGPASTGAAVNRISLNDLTKAGTPRGTRSSFRLRMEKLGVFTTKAIPWPYLRGSVKQRLALVQGLMDSDGYVNPGTGNCTFSNTNLNIIDGMIELLRSLGYTPRAAPTKPNEFTRDTCWKIEFRGTPEAMPFRLRDTEKIRPRTHKNMRRIVSIEETQPVPVRCVEVDSEEHLFLAGENWTVTSNCHQLVSRGKAGAEWLLHLLQDGRLLTSAGEERMPNITIIAATTDIQKLPLTVISRFPVRPVLQPYNTDEAALIAAHMATKVGFGSGAMPLPALTWETLTAVAEASNREPREIRRILVSLRDALRCDMTPTVASGDYDLTTALAWCSLTPDGLDATAQDYLCTLLAVFEGKAGEKTIASAITAPGGCKHTEASLVNKGYLTITGSGRQLTTAGIDRADSLLRTLKQ